MPLRSVYARKTEKRDHLEPKEGDGPPSASRGELTVLLQAWSQGCDRAGDALAARVYPRLRRQAASMLTSHWAGNDLQATEVVHEAFLRLVRQRHVHWNNRDHFLAMATCFIRRVLLNRVRHLRTCKRGGETELVSLERVEPAAVELEVDRPDLLWLDGQLRRLAKVEPVACRVVELRYFGGLTVNETAAVLSIGRATVVRKWKTARTWLRAAESERHGR
jgi:RNA polymerase sigma factor (TIGR02999 family)